MPSSSRYTGKDLVVEFLPTGGTYGSDEITLSGSFTSFSYDRSGDTADVTAGNETSRSHIPTIESLTWQLSFIDEANDEIYEELKPLSTGLLMVYPQGKGSGNTFFSFNAIIEAFNHSFPFDDKVECELSGVRNGEMVAEVGTPISQL